MPRPVSLTVNSAYCPGRTPGHTTATRFAGVGRACLERHLPPWGMASRALAARLSSTCSTCPRSAITVGR